MIKATLRPLREGVRMAQVIPKIEAAMQTFLEDAPEEWKWHNIKFVKETDETTGKLHRIVQFTARPYPSKISPKSGRRVSSGRPPKRVLRPFLAALVDIYEKSTGKYLGRTYQPTTKDANGKEKPHPYIVACLLAVGIRDYPTGLIQEVLEAAHQK